MHVWALWTPCEAPAVKTGRDHRNSTILSSLSWGLLVDLGRNCARLEFSGCRVKPRRSQREGGRGVRGEEVLGRSSGTWQKGTRPKMRPGQVQWPKYEGELARLWGRRGLTRQPENSKRAHFRAPALQNTTKIPREDPQEGEERKANVAGEVKKREILGSPPFGAPTLLGERNCG